MVVIQVLMPTNTSAGAWRHSLRLTGRHTRGVERMKTELEQFYGLIDEIKVSRVPTPRLLRVTSTATERSSAPSL